MKKLDLRIESLAVQSFATGDAEGQAGTVQAYEALATWPAACDPFSQPPRCS
ncbi:MAG TPA: hypothetical protein VLK84_19390 [Longimicrobium sp.]|nr:hypothetical protein [Longimicrobium sp.]